MLSTRDYDKSDGTLNLTQDEEIVAVINTDTVVDESDTLSFEIALDVSQYQEQFNEIIDGNDN